jgi:hypothetical protein
MIDVPFRLRCDRRCLTWLVGGLATVAVAIAGLSALGNRMQGALMLTTADPGLIGTMQTASLQPVEVVVGTQFEASASHDALGRRIQQKFPTAREHWIQFRLPAAYVTGTGKAREDKYPWRVAFSAWSDSFEPFMLDLARSQDDRVRRGVARNAPVRDDDLLQLKMRATGETARDFELTGTYRPEDYERQRVLRAIGLKEGMPTPKPCDRDIDTETGMQRVTVPRGVNPYESCLSGKGENGVNYARVRNDGTIKFVVECDASGIGRDGTPRQPHRCRMLGHFRVWPLVIWVEHAERTRFDAIHDRVLNFLTGHLVDEQ